MSHNYENLEVYKRSLKLASNILICFHEFKPFRIGEQICASAVSIPSNISEGAERNNDKYFKQYLDYACGSAAELNTQLIIIKESKLDVGFEINDFLDELKEIRKMLRGLNKKFSKK